MMVSLSALLGYVCKTSTISPQAFIVFASILLLAAGCATLNNIQDRHSDKNLERTKNRPLASNKIALSTAFSQALILMTIGLAGLKMGPPNNNALYSAIIAVVLYNGIYTPLKKKSILAIIPGAVCGMLPPLIGWQFAGAGIISADIILLMVIFGIWQLPHFWLLLLRYKQDYQHRAPINMLSIFTSKQLSRIIFCWVSAFATLVLFVPLFNIVQAPFSIWLLAANAVTLIGSFSYCLFFPGNNKDTRHPRLFIQLNISLFLLIATTLADRLV